ncbi:hypothetical protein E5Q_04775 [Mixia osmundae IAM 14324]|uniref:Fatty acid hydroxylase domain-containing protein n=1 Tax=Mixia osmundae (strain CBS 9802 / IAM 14324 / JCM 22182 / KY 12970) TaxID=764103 RepID=G7E5I3_MIXOS|nr:hypothetical protein E5Q_04775 [Mixia osmundae IAM 14324]
MLFSDWSKIMTFLMIHVVVVPFIQHEMLHLTSLPAIFVYHLVAQLLFHRNINKILASDFRVRYGYLKKDSPRTKLPAVELKWTKMGGLLGAFFRIATLFIADGQGSRASFGISPTWIVHYSAYVLLLDFVFYWAHRTQHEHPFLYKYVHGKHHRAHLPNVLMTVHDTIFEKFFNTFIQMCLINWIIPMSFWDLHTTYYAIHLIEALGHSGIKCHLTNPLMPWLVFCKTELSIEDHDLHHRKLRGNYGKQTLVWDVLFGTNLPRIET